MTRVLVVWEDRYYDTLGPFVKRRVTAHAPPGQLSFPQVLFHTAYGNGSFKRYVASTWDNARAKGLPRDEGPIEHLICVVDGDKLHEQVDTIAAPPVAAADVGAWLATAEGAWQEHLRALCESAPKTTVHGLVLRWSKESLVLAGYDREAVKDQIGIDIQATELQEHLARCVPAPASIEGPAFSDTFRKPLRCLKELDEAQRAPRASGLVKNAPELDDALRALARQDCALIAERVPDIDRIAKLIWKLAAPASPPAVAAAPAANSTTGHKKGSKKSRTK